MEIANDFFILLCHSGQIVDFAMYIEYRHLSMPSTVFSNNNSVSKTGVCFFNFTREILQNLHLKIWVAPEI